MDYRDKVVLVTGGANGIGKAIAEHYAAAGAAVIIADKDTPNGRRAVESIRSRSGTAVFIAADISNPCDVEKLFEDIQQQFARIDVLINNAGVGSLKSLFELTVEEWDLVIDTNLRGAFLCAREAAKVMRCHGGGSIINIASTRWLMSEPNSEAYAASKGGIVSLTHSLAVSLGKYGIRVNCISPGWIETGDYQALRSIDHEQHPAGRVGRPEDIARACLFLSDCCNDFITGANIVIDGGMTRKMIYLD